MELTFRDILAAVCKFTIMLIPAAIVENMSGMPKGLLLVIVFITVFIFAFIQMINRWAKYENTYQLLKATRLNLAPIQNLAEGEQMLLILAQQVDEIEANASEWQRIASESEAKAQLLQSEFEKLQSEYEANAAAVKSNAEQKVKLLERTVSELEGALNELRAKYAALQAKYSKLESGDMEEQYEYARSLINKLNATKRATSLVK